MRVYRLAPAELSRAVADAEVLVKKIAARQAALLVDVTELAAKELLVASLNGDRETAERLHCEAFARRKG
jgi:hypothetical protein